MSEEERYELQDLISDACDELEEAWEDGLKEESDPSDRCHEIADGQCPIYNHAILKYAANNPNLACDEPECGPAFDGTATPINIITANIYEALSNALHQKLYELQNEDDDDEAEVA